MSLLGRISTIVPPFPSFAQRKRGIEAEPSNYSVMRSSLKQAPHLLLITGALLITGLMLRVATPSGADTLRAGTTVLVSAWPDGSPTDGAEPSVSSDGRYVAFSTLHPFVSADPDLDSDIYRKDMLTGEMLLVSPNVSGVPTFSQNFMPSISGDGSKVAYLSGQCFPDITTEAQCVGVFAHVRDLPASSTRLVSDPTATVPTLRISLDGRWTAMVQKAEGACWAITSDTANAQIHGVATVGSCDSGPGLISISESGRFVAFESEDRVILTDNDGNTDVYVLDRDTDADGIFDEPGATSFTLAGKLPDGTHAFAVTPEISGDGTKVAFVARSFPETLVFESQVYVRNLQTNTTTLASQSSFGVKGSGYREWRSHPLAISGSGNLVAFNSYDSHLATPDINPFMDVYMRNVSLKKTTMESLLPDGNQDLGEKRLPAFSADGNFLAFGTTRLLDDSRLERRVYLRDLRTPCPVICLP